MAGKAVLVEDYVRAILGVFEAGKFNSEQASAINDIRVMLGDADNSCQHDGGVVCDASNVFHCEQCGEEVEAP